MNKEKLETILNTYYGVPVNQWVKLEKMITVISLDQEANLYPDQTELYYFDTVNGLMYVSKNYGYKKITSPNLSLGSYKISFYIDIDKIAGFVSTSVVGPYGTIMER